MYLVQSCSNGADIAEDRVWFERQPACRRQGIASLIHRRLFAARSTLPRGARDVRLARREPFDHQWGAS
jgi:hypothetical protein